MIACNVVTWFSRRQATNRRCFVVVLLNVGEYKKQKRAMTNTVDNLLEKDLAEAAASIYYKDKD